MFALRQILRRHRQGLWALVAAVLWAQLVPMHLHFHHAGSTPDAAVVHVLDLHVAGNASDQEHHGDAHVTDMSGKTVVKQWQAVSPPPLVIAWLAVLFVAATTRALWRPPRAADLRPRTRFAVAPPLRAPPRS